MPETHQQANRRMLAKTVQSTPLQSEEFVNSRPVATKRPMVEPTPPDDPRGVVVVDDLV
jgi:hypothetical protein